MSYPTMINGWCELAERVDDEYDRAKKLFPGANNNTLALCEEHGELVKAVLDFSQDKSNMADVKKELVQTMAMCLRLWFQGDETVGLPPVSGLKHIRA